MCGGKTFSLVTSQSLNRGIKRTSQSERLSRWLGWNRADCSIIFTQAFVVYSIMQVGPRLVARWYFITRLVVVTATIGLYFPSAASAKSQLIWSLWSPVSFAHFHSSHRYKWCLYSVELTRIAPSPGCLYYLFIMLSQFTVSQDESGCSRTDLTAHTWHVAWSGRSEEFWKARWRCFAPSWWGRSEKYSQEMQFVSVPLICLRRMFEYVKSCFNSVPRICTRSQGAPPVCPIMWRNHRLRHWSETFLASDHPASRADSADTPPR